MDSKTETLVEFENQKSDHGDSRHSHPTAFDIVDLLKITSFSWFSKYIESITPVTRPR